MGSRNRHYPRFFPTRCYTPARMQPASNSNRRNQRSKQKEPPMATAAQILANQANAQHSTGPATPAGKAASSRNRLNHGFRSATVLLPGDDPAEYEALLTELSEHFDPTDLTDTRFVREMADAEWRLRGVRGHMESALARHMLTLAPQNPALDPRDLQSLAVETLHQTGCSYATWLRYETKFERQYDRAYNAWSRYQATKQPHSTAETDHDIEPSCGIPPADPEPASVQMASNVHNPDGLGNPADLAPSPDPHTCSRHPYSPSGDTLLQDAH